MADRKQERQLLGYVLGALDDCENDRIDRRLAADPELRKKLVRAETSLEPLRRVVPVHRPPPGLAARTCRMVFAYSEALAVRAIAAASTRPPRQRARAMSPAAVPPSSTATWGWSDLLVAAGVFLVVSCSIFPAIQRGRMNTRLNLCQDNLRQVGLSQAQFREFHRDALGGFHGDTLSRFHGGASGGAVASTMAVPLASLLSRGGIQDFRTQPATLTPTSYTAEPSPQFSSAAASGASLGHQGFTQAVQGQNLLFSDGRVMFMAMGPVFQPAGDAFAGDNPRDNAPVAAWPAGSDFPVSGPSGLVPIAPIGCPRP
jgi:hypothetical protein